MRSFLQLIVVGSALVTLATGIKLGGNLFKVAKKFTNAKRYIPDEETITKLGDAAGLSYAACGSTYRASLMAAFHAMSEGRQKDAYESMKLTMATFAAFDTGQGIIAPMADKLVDTIVKNSNKFPNTVQAVKDYGKRVKETAFDEAGRNSGLKRAKQKLLKARSKISVAFDTEFENLRGTSLYNTLGNDLKHAKKATKVAKWGTTLVGPIFDAVSIGLGTWQLIESIKKNDATGIATNALGIAAGVVGITSFAISALATAGTTLAVVAGPAGAIVGAILGLAGILVEYIANNNEYERMTKDLHKIRKVTRQSKKQLDKFLKNMNNLKSNNKPFEFSLVYYSNEGFWLNGIPGRKADKYEPLTFALPNQPLLKKDKDGYFVTGEERMFDKSQYKGSWMWDSGKVPIGYDFIGKNVNERGKFHGVTVITSTSLVDRSGEHLRGVEIKTFNDVYNDMDDNVLIGELFDSDKPVEVNTGAGDDTILLNGLLGKECDKVYENQLRVRTSVDITKETNVFSLEGMDINKAQNRCPNLKGFYFRFKNSMRGDPTNFYLLMGREKSRKKRGFINGIKLFIGSKLDDHLAIHIDQDYIVREYFGENVYHISVRDYYGFKITIDDRSKTKGTIEFSTGINVQKDIMVSYDYRTLYVYCKYLYPDLVGVIVLGSQKGIRSGDMLVADASDKHFRFYVDSLQFWKPWPGTINKVSQKDDLQAYRYKFDESLQFDFCGDIELFVDPPASEPRPKLVGRYQITKARKTKTKHSIVLTKKFYENCIKAAKRLVKLVRIGEKMEWQMRVTAVTQDDMNKRCPVKQMEVDIPDFQSLKLDKNILTQRRTNTLLVDLRLDDRTEITLNTEIQKLLGRKTYTLKPGLEIKGTYGKPEDVIVLLPVKPYPAMDNKNPIIELMGGEKGARDSVIITDNVFKAAKGLKLVKTTEEQSREAEFELQVYNKNGHGKYTVYLSDVERILYQEGDNLFAIFDEMFPGNELDLWKIIKEVKDDSDKEWKKLPECTAY